MPPSEEPHAIDSYSSSKFPKKRKLSPVCRWGNRDPSTNAVPLTHNLSSPVNNTHSSKRYKAQLQNMAYNCHSTSNMQAGKMSSLATVTGSYPQTGTRKLVIKNLKVARLPSLQDHYALLRDHVETAVMDVYNGRQPQQPLELLYRDVEDICRNGQAEQLYQHLSAKCSSYLESCLLPNISASISSRATTVEILKAVNAAWEQWNIRSMQIRSIFSYLDRSYLLSSKVHPQLNDMAIFRFRDIICGKGRLGRCIYQGICELIKMDRNNQETSFDPVLLRDSVLMLHIMGVYKTEFESILLDESETYFEELHETVWASLTLKDYILNCVKLLEREGARCDKYNFDSATKRALLNNAQSILVKRPSARLLNTFEVAKLLEENESDTLKALYELLKASNMQSDLKGPWEAYIKKAGSRIVSDPEKGDSMVVGLLELKRSLEVISRDAFNKDEQFKYALREAYSSFINDRKNTISWGMGQSKVGEVIAKYIDLLLRGGLKAVPRSLASDAIDREDAEKRGQASTGDEDAELDRQLEQGIELFRFIQGKDVFEAFYKKDLARRLLMSRSASQDAERNMLTKLKSECGSNFTHNLEQMFKDQELSRDEMIAYKQSLANTSKTTLDLQVSVLSAAAWPTYPDVAVNLPSEVAKHIEKFDSHYRHKHTGRKLAWKHALAHSIVKAHFKKGSKELVVSGFQAVVLVLFNDINLEGNLSYTDIQTATGLVDAELQRTLQSLACAKIRVLNKHPKGRDVLKTDTFTVNTTFSDPKFRIKINQIQLKETKEEIQETHERVSQDRQYETQAAIVRIMKSRKTMTHSDLVSEIISQTKSRGAVEVGEIKKNIEKLIEKDYLERGDDRTYTYLA